MRAFPLVLVALAALAVGPAVLASTSVTWSTPVMLGDVLLGAEPAIATAPDGTVYMGTPAADVARSDDMGHTWQNVGTTYCLGLASRSGTFSALPACPLASSDPGLDGGGDTSFAVGPTGTLYHLGLSGNSGSVPFQRSTDKGAHFSLGVDLASGHSADRQWIVTAPSGKIYASWRDLDVGAVVMRSSTDGGVTWSSPVNAANDGHQGPIAVDPANEQNLYLPHVDGTDLFVAKSTNGGASWTQIRIGHVYQDTADFPIVAVDSAGTVYLVWNQDPSILAHTAFETDSLIKITRTLLSVSKDHGATWSAPVGVSPAGVPSMFPWIAAGSAGRIVVTWYEGLVPAPAERTPSVWHVGVGVSIDADSATPHFDVSDASGVNHVGAICTWGLLCNLSGGDRSLLDFFEVAITPDGAPVIVYAHDSTAYQGYTSVYGVRAATSPNLWG